MDCYNVQHPERKVYNNQDIFTNIDFNVSFIDNKTARDYLLKFYWNWSMVYPDKNYMNRQIQLYADMSRDYWEDMAKTYKYEYDPLVNIDLTEEKKYKIDEAGNVTSNATQKGLGKGFEKPYDYTQEVERNMSTSEANSVTDAQSGRVLEYTEVNKKYGDASLRTIPEFIKIERGILDSLITNYISGFKDLFYLDI